jgi:hypothetical protein
LSGGGVVLNGQLEELGVGRRTLLKSLVPIIVPDIAMSFSKRLEEGSFSTAIGDVMPDLERRHKWDQSNGDTWDPFWADDDNLYAFNCDGRGFGNVARNLAFNKLTGTRPELLAGQMINTMDEYGVAGKKEADNATWKVCGQECIDSVFYAFVSRNVYGKDSGDSWLRQTAYNSSLIKSHNRGLSWQRDAKANYASPMWPGPKFGAPFFIHYGKNGGQVSQDGADEYAYAVSTNGFWNDGDSYVLGRVRRSKLPDLVVSDWTYYTGGDGRQQKNWSGDIGRAVPILTREHQCGQTPPCYIAPLKSYLMVLWYNTAKMTTWFEPNEMRYDFYSAEHPWGPWAFVNSVNDRFLPSGHMYGPSLCAKFQEQKGSNVQISLFTSGCPFEDVPSGLYKLWTIPLILST